MSVLLEEMIEMWGNQFQELNNLERLWMACKITENLCVQEDEDVSIGVPVHDALERIDELNTRDKLNLIQALINQVLNPC